MLGVSLTPVETASFHCSPSSCLHCKHNMTAAHADTLEWVFLSSKSNETTAAWSFTDHRMPGDFAQGVLMSVLLQLHCSGRQPGSVRACRTPTRHVGIRGQFWVARAGKYNSHPDFVLALVASTFLTWKPEPSAVMVWNAGDVKAMSPAWKKNLLCVLNGWNHIHIWSNLWYRKALKQGNGTCQKHIQSPMRTFCLSRHTNQAQINQLWLSEIFLIQPFRWLGSIGKSLTSKKAQKGILLQCLLKTT